MITIPLTVKTMQQFIIKPWRRFEGLCCLKKIKKNMKNCKYFKKLLKLMILKSWRTFHYISKLCSNILSNPTGIFAALELEKPKKWQKIFKKNKKIASFIKINCCNLWYQKDENWSMNRKKFPVTYYQTLTEAFWPSRFQKIWIMSINVKNWRKMAKNIKNMLKFVMLKPCKTFHLI